MKNTADLVAESCVGGFVMIENGRKQNQFPSERVTLVRQFWCS